MAKKKASRKTAAATVPETSKSSAARCSKPARQPSASGQRNRNSEHPTDRQADTTAGDNDVSPESETCVVVGVGASAGGLDAYKRFLRQLPDATGSAFVLIPHLDPTHDSLMAELLSRYTNLPVLQAQQGMPIRPDHVYLIPPGRFLRIDGNYLLLDEPVPQRGVRLPIDHFFRSLAATRKQRAVCIVLSGTGSDGSQGLRDVKAAGGLTIVQQPETAEHDGMPRSAISTGSVDFVLPLEAMSDVIIPFIRQGVVPKTIAALGPRSAAATSVADQSPDQIKAIVELLQEHTDHDFSNYKTGTLSRRIQRRMSNRQLNNIARYRELLQQDPAEVQALFQDLLIGVTRFFRDPDAWAQLQKTLSSWLSERDNTEPLRIWVPGCATGEEVYSIAILLNELKLQQGLALEVQVFGTDIDRDAIETARLGVYPEAIARDLSSTRLQTWFHRQADRLQVRKSLRESCIFAVQNLLSDPPFSGLDLICCRNLLIYLRAGIQQRIFELLHFALKPDGLLFLGSSESPARRGQLFATVSQESRIYQKVGDSKPGEGNFSFDGPRAVVRGELLRTQDQLTPANTATSELSKRALLDEFAPPSVVVNTRGVIEYIHGPVRNFLDFPHGAPHLDLATMAVEGLRSKIRVALLQAKATAEPVTLTARRVHCESGEATVRVRVQPLPAEPDSQGLYLVSFLQAPVASTAGGNSKIHPVQEATDENGGDESRTVQQLALELQATREDLQSTIEELESANEELKASNEEVMSMNGELQSTNEELESSREELQSLNEELSTVNNQLHDKVQELEATTNDLTNLLTSTDLATLFLDQDLRIRRFTPATMELMNLLDTDLGRPLSDLSSRVSDPELVRDARQVLKQLTPIETEVQDNRQRVFMRRITPFRTADNKIAGVVITFSDVTRLQQASRRVEFRERQQAVIAQLGRIGLASDDLDALFACAAQEIAKTLDVELANVLKLEPDGRSLLLLAGVGWQNGLVGTVRIPSGRNSQAGYTLNTGNPVIVRDLAAETRFQGPQLLLEHGVVSGMSVIIGPEQGPWGVLGVYAQRQIDFTVDDTNFILAVANVLWEAIRRHTIEDELRDNEARTAAFLKNSAVIGWMKDEQGRYMFLSDNYERRFNIRREDWYGRTDADVWPAAVAATLRENDLKVLNNNQAIEAVEEVVGPDGTVSRFMVSKFGFTDAVGRRYVGGLAVDVTKRIEAEQALARSQWRLQHLIDSASFGIAIARNDGAVLQANDAMLKIFNIERSDFELRGWDWRDRVLPENNDFAETMLQLGRDGTTLPIEIKRRDDARSTVWVLASARPIDDESSEYVAFLVDITAQKEAELALSESEERMRLAAQMAGFGTYYGDPETGTVTWSPELKRILGLNPDDQVSNSLTEVSAVVHPDDRARVLQRMMASMDPAGDGEYHDEHRVVRPDGEVRWILMRGRTVFRSDGTERRPVRIAGVGLDITQRHRFEEELDAARRAAEAANAAKSLFLANMSHEIRTPMTAILGFADVLHARLQDPDDQACIKTIKANGDHLCDILNDILDLAKIESGKLTIRREDCDVVAVLSHIRSLMAVRAMQSGLTLSVEFEGQIPKSIQTDPKMLRQILLNLLGNAVKFTERGGIRVLVKCLADQELLEISVSDTGIGIQQDKLQSLFLPFEQLDNSATRTAGGTGLGLSITRRLVEALGGRIRVESTVGEGSTFQFTLATGPLANGVWISADSHALAEEDSELFLEQLPRISGRILAVDDRREIRFLVQEFVESAGGDVVTAADGAQAVDIWRHNRDLKNSFDAVLMDLQMPVMDGLHATRQLRKEGYTGPIIALTANAMRKDRDECALAGCNDFISKPIDRVELIQKLAGWMNQRSTPATADQRIQGVQVLCVDDNPAVCSMHKVLLEQRGHQVTVAHSAAQALAAVEHFQPQAVLLDLGLRDMSGAELLQRLKQRQDLAECLFVCLSGRQERDIAWQDLGFHYFLQKPADIDDVSRVLANGKTG